MVIRAKDQASRVINGLSRSASADFRRLQTAATLTAQRSSIDMAKVRQHYSNQILGQQKVLNNAIQTGNKTRASSARQAIRDLGIMRQEEILGIKQEQLTQREIMHTAEKQAMAKAAAREAKVEAARAGGQWIAVGAGMALAGAMGIKALHGMAMEAVEYQRQATMTLTQTDKVKTSVSELQGISTRVARSIGVPLEELQPALYDIFSSMNVNVKQSEQLLTAFAKEAVAGQVSIQDASRSTIGIMNAFHIPVSKVNDVLDFQFQLVRKGVGTFGQFANVIGRATPSAVRAGQSYQTLGAMMAFLTRNGLSAAMAAASAGRALDAFANPSVAAKFANLGEVIQKESGLSAQRLRELGVDTANVSVKIRDAHGNFRGFIPVMGELSAVISKLPAPSRAAVLKELFKGAGGTIQAMRYFNVVIPRFKEQNDLLRDMMHSSGAFEQAYRQMSESIAVKTEILNNNWKIFKLNLGEGALPALNRFIVAGTKALQWFNDLDPTQRHAISQVIMFTSVIVGASGVLIALAGAIKVASASMGILGLTAQGAAGRFILARVAVGGFLTTLGMATVAIGLAANADKLLADAQEHGASIHEKFIRPFYQQIGLIPKSTANLHENANAAVVSAGKYGQWHRQVGTATSALTGNYHAMTAAEIAAEHLNERGIKPLITSTSGASRELIKHTGSQNASREGIQKTVAAMQKEQKEFDGITRVAKMSATQVTKAFQNQLEDTRNYSHNLRILLRRGVDPSFVKELAARGPEYVAAYARGSKRELLKGQAAWRQIHHAQGERTKAMAEVAKAAIEGYRKNQIFNTLRASGAWKRMTDDQKRKINAAMHDARVDVDAFQKKVDKLHGKKIKVQADAIVRINDSVRMYLKAASVPGFHAAGGIIRGPGGPRDDKIPAYLSNGEYVVNAAATSKYRPVLEQINAQKFAAGGPVGWLSQYNSKVITATERIGQSFVNRLAASIGKGLGKALEKGMLGGSSNIKQWIRAQDPKPYIWGAAGPGGFDCSGLVGAVYGLMRGIPGSGRGRRFFTTSSISTGVPGLRSGLGGLLNIGVTAGTGHMAGMYGGLKFEARSTRSGIITGPGARSPGSFARTFHMARGGFVNPREMRAIARMVRREHLDINGDVDNPFVNYRGRRRRFHSGGTLPEDILGVGSSGTAYEFQGGEKVTARGGGEVHIHFHGPVYGGKAGAQELVDVVVQGIAKKARTYGGTVNVTANRRGSPVIR